MVTRLWTLYAFTKQDWVYVSLLIQWTKIVKLLSFWEWIILAVHIGKWYSPPTTGSRPPPCAYFSFTAINDYQGVLFAGKQIHGRSNDCFLLNIKSMVCPDRFCNTVMLHTMLLWNLTLSRLYDQFQTLVKLTVCMCNVSLVLGVDPTGEA